MYSTLFTGKIISAFSITTKIIHCEECNYKKIKFHTIINAHLPTNNLNFILDIIKSTYEDNITIGCRLNDNQINNFWLSFNN
jgi:hypothetical protein